ncbi:MAG: A24 family peptidase [Candidatus Woesearchaeota archaeon]
MIADIILVAAAIMALVFASVADIRSKEIPDWLNFSLLVLALGVRLLYSLQSNEWWYFFYGFLGMVVMFAIGYVFYCTRQWGGGDTKLIMALGAVFATRPYFVEGSFPFLISMGVNMLIVGSAYGLLWTLFIYLKNFRLVNAEALRLVKTHRLLRWLSCLFAIIFLVSAFFVPGLWIVCFMLAGTLFAYPYLLYIVKAVEMVGMYKRLPVRKLVEGDWVAESVKANNKVICSPKDNGISKEQILMLKRSKVKDVLVKEGIPFVPSFLIAVVLTLIFDNLVFLFI